MILSEGQLMFTPCNLVPDHVIVPDHTENDKSKNVRPHQSLEETNLCWYLYIYNSSNKVKNVILVH